MKEEKGAALLALLLVVLAGSSYILVSKLNENARQKHTLQSTQEALDRAKNTLLGYAIRFPEIDAESGSDPIDGPGYLPCPDVNGDGNAGGSCSFGGNTTMGRFPFRTLETPVLRDGYGERLWYVLSENYKAANGKTLPLNSEVPGLLKVDSKDDVVAIIIAPGTPLSNQNDRVTQSNSVDQYLEGDNSDGDREFVTSASDDVNDIVRFITRDELMVAVEKRVLGELINSLKYYYATNGYYPWLSSYSDPRNSDYQSEINTCQGHLSLTLGMGDSGPVLGLPSWIPTNNWHHQILLAYSDDVQSGCSDQARYKLRQSGTITDVVVIAIMAGKSLNGQDRTSGAIDEYYEGNNNDQDFLFEKQTPTNSFNDQIKYIK